VRHLTKEQLDHAVTGGGHTFKTTAQGAATSTLVATSPAVEGIGGRYFEDCAEARPHVPGTTGGVAPHARDPDAAAHLWQVSLDAFTTRTTAG
jgi:hypothetical protein